MLMYVHALKCENERKRLSGVSVEPIGFSSVRCLCPSKQTAKGGLLIGCASLKVTGKGQRSKVLEKGFSQTDILQCCI